MLPLVSIITPLHNCENFIRQTAESIFKQEFSSWEWIVIDDCSVDNSLSIVEYFAKLDDRIIIIKNDANIGSGASRNRGIEFARGRYIAFLDSDDLWFSNKLKQQINFMLDNNFVFTFTHYEKVDENGIFLKDIKKVSGKLSYSDISKVNKIGCLTAIYDSEYFGKVFMDTLRKRQDYSLWLKLLKNGDFAYCLPQVLASYRVRSGGISGNKLSLFKYNFYIYRHIEGKGYITSTYYLVYAILYKIFKG